MPDEIISQDYDPDFSHAMLVAVLVKLGGSIELDATDLAPDALGNAEGVLYRIALEPLPGQRVRLSVVPTAADIQQR
jgi:hypothetical protein